MPDWTYQTFLKPPLTKLGFDRGSAFALGSMGRLAAIPGGRWLIQIMGHTHPDPRLHREHQGMEFCTPVGLGCGIDPQLRATTAFAEFGVGYLEVGPIVESRSATGHASEMDFVAERISYSPQEKAFTADQAAARLGSPGDRNVPLFARLLSTSDTALCAMIDTLAPQVDGFVVPAALIAQATEHLQTRQLQGEKAVFAAVGRDDICDDIRCENLRATFASADLAGAIVSSSADCAEMGKPLSAGSLELVGRVRELLGADALLIGAGGIHSPADALDFRAAGADLVQVDSGLVFAGPSLPKRINEAMLYLHHGSDRESPYSGSLPQQSWFWAFLMGLGMFVGGLLALAIALTRVVMPYDESLVGMLRAELASINDRLLPFMQHDRVTLAGTMLAIGVLYMALARFGIRRGATWAYIAIVISATLGFFSFFTFLGFGYFDPFHAFVSAVLLQFLLLTTTLKQPQHRHVTMPELWNDWRWRLRQWGQLAYVIHGAILIVAGLVISNVGMTSVFVPEDLEFLRCSERVLTDANPMLVPLIAHDRATFGGMLIASGVVTLLAGLWGFRRGEAWLWWALTIAGTSAYLATIWVHWAVGYDSLWHLLPAYGGLTLLWVGSAASYSSMVGLDPDLLAEWQRRWSVTA